MQDKISAADQAIITQALLAAANEMGAKLIRSAHSPNCARSVGLFYCIVGFAG